MSPRTAMWVNGSMIGVNLAFGAASAYDLTQDHHDKGRTALDVVALAATIPLTAISIPAFVQSVKAHKALKAEQAKKAAGQDAPKTPQAKTTAKAVAGEARQARPQVHVVA